VGSWYEKRGKGILLTSILIAEKRTGKTNGHLGSRKERDYYYRSEKKGRGACPNHRRRDKEKISLRTLGGCSVWGGKWPRLEKEKRET